MNNKFVMAAAQKWLRDLLLMLDLGKLFWTKLGCAFPMVFTSVFRLGHQRDHHHQEVTRWVTHLTSMNKVPTSWKNFPFSTAGFRERNGRKRLSPKLYETSVSRDVNPSGERITKTVQTPDVSRTQKKTRRFWWPDVFIVTSWMTLLNRNQVDDWLQAQNWNSSRIFLTDLWTHTLPNKWVIYYSELTLKLFKGISLGIWPGHRQGLIRTTFNRFDP